MSAESKPACVGRPRSFDPEVALEQALEVFWRNGYEGASLAELTQAMGIKKPSMYATFGNKEQLFLKAIDLYHEREGAWYKEAYAKESYTDFVEALLYGAARSYTASDKPHGCALVKSTLSCSEASESVKETLLAQCNQSDIQLVNRIKLAQETGEICPEAAPESIARFIGTMLHGMSSQADQGATHEELKEVVKVAVFCIEAAVKQPCSGL